MTPRNDKSGSRLPRLFRESDFESRSVAVGLIPKCGACWKEKPGVPSGRCLMLESISLRACRALGVQSSSYICGLQFSQKWCPQRDLHATDYKAGWVGSLVVEGGGRVIFVLTLVSIRSLSLTAF